MAFKRAVVPIFSVLVTVNVPNDKGGFDKNTFTAMFKRPKAEERLALGALTNEALVRDRLVGWDLRDADSGESVPFTPEEFDALMQIEPTPIATAEAYWNTVNGAKAKN